MVLSRASDLRRSCPVYICVCVVRASSAHLSRCPAWCCHGRAISEGAALCTAVHLCVRGAGGRVDGQCACGACLARVGGPRRPSLKSGVHSHWVPPLRGAARILCIVPKSRAFSHMRRRSASKAAEAVPLDQLAGANGACSSGVGTPIACTLEHASATRARRGVTARAKKERSVCVFT